MITWFKVHITDIHVYYGNDYLHFFHFLALSLLGRFGNIETSSVENTIEIFLRYYFQVHGYLFHFFFHIYFSVIFIILTITFYSFVSINLVAINLVLANLVVPKLIARN